MGRPASGPKNPNWRGGRTTASTGYVLIRVGVGHPLADVRGYAYEHRLVAMAKIGRLLRKGEVVHHIDGNRKNNSWDNIEVHSSVAEHLARHRKTSGKRMPGEINPLVGCACGCRGRFRRYDSANRPRRFFQGHNTRTR